MPAPPLSSSSSVIPTPQPIGSTFSFVDKFAVGCDNRLLSETETLLPVLEPLLLADYHDEDYMLEHESFVNEDYSSASSVSTSSSRAGSSPLYCEDFGDSDKKEEFSSSASGAVRNASTLLSTPPTTKNIVSSMAISPNTAAVRQEYHNHHRHRDSSTTMTTKKKSKGRQAKLWETRFNELVHFKRRHGHCLVPYKYKENPQLATWVKRQRFQRKLRLRSRKGCCSLTQYREESLDDLGFVWDSHKASWEEKYNELVDFKNTFGHTRVPWTYEHNHSLAVWVHGQRRQWKLSQGSNNESFANPEKEARFHRLEALGFDWDPRKQKTDAITR